MFYVSLRQPPQWLRWSRLICQVCLRQQARQFSRSIALTTTEILPPRIRAEVGSAEPESQDVNSGPLTPKRPHLKNSGQYYVTTPIFYVNGG